jgi:arsenite-transporting ATPase
VAEARRSFAYLSLYGVGTDAVLVNRLLPGSASSGYFARWAEREREELHEIEESFPVPILAAPLERVEPIGVDALRGLADRLFGERDPAGFYTRVRPIRLRKRAHRTVMEIELPGASKEEVDVILAGAELHIRVRDARRRIALPASIEGREIESVRLTEGVLELLFSP